MCIYFMLPKSPLQEQSPKYISRTAIMEDPSHYEQNSENEIKATRLLKRIPLKRLMDLKVDYAFKQLFGNEKNKNITKVSFVNSYGSPPLVRIKPKNGKVNGFSCVRYVA